MACCCCPCVAGQSIGCWEGLGDASSFGQGDGRESDRHDTGVLGGLACLQACSTLKYQDGSHQKLPNYV